MDYRIREGRLIPAALVATLCLLWISVGWAKATLTLNLQEADINAVIATVSEMTGKNFIVDPRVKGKVTILSSKPMDSDEVYQVFLSILNVHGFAAIPGKNVIKIVPEANAKQDAVDTVDSKHPGEGDQFVTRIIPVENVSASQLVPILRPLLPQQGHLAAYPATNVLIASGTAANISRIVDLVRKVDYANEAEFELVALKHASAEEIARILSSLQQEEKKGGKASTVDESLTILADSRTNAVILKGDKSQRQQYRNIIERLDTPADGGGNTKVIYLRYASATDLVSVLGGVAQGIVNGQGKAQAKGGNAAARLDIQADASTNALVINATPEVIKELESIIRQLDIRRAQVMVKAIIAEISSDKSAEFGLSWGYDGSSGGTSPVGLVDFNGNLAGLYSASNALSAPPALNGLSLIAGGMTSGGSRYGALIRAIKGDADSNILSTPTLVTLDNQEAEIVVGQNVPFVTGSYSSTGSSSTPSNPFQTIKREDVGLSLKIKPQINEGDSIRLEIKQEVSSLSAAATSATDLVTNKRSLSTTVMVDDGQILALGGLLDETLNESEQKVPGLGDIPILGWLFSHKRTTKVKRDLTIFLHPRIIRDGKQGMAISSRKYNLLRAQQIHSEELLSGLLDTDVPTVPELADFLELPPPYDEATGAATSAAVE